MEKSVKIKLMYSQAMSFARYLEQVSSTQPPSLNMEAKLIISTVRLVRKRVISRLLTHKREYKFVLPPHEALAVLVATQKIPFHNSIIDRHILNTVIGTIHQAMV